MHPEVDLNDEAREDRPTAEAPPDDASPHGAGATLPYVDSSANPVSLPTMQTGESDMPRIPGLDRYEDLGVLGQGGMGEVRRVRDRRLGRTLALKIIRPRALNRPGLVARFLEEAQATAQLQHPNIVPVYDLGELPDGRLWFTMKEVTGQTLATVLKLLRGAPVEASVPAHQAWTFRRAVSALVQGLRGHGLRPAPRRGAPGPQARQHHGRPAR